jgi:hypothetical protein
VGRLDAATGNGSNQEGDYRKDQQHNSYPEKETDRVDETARDRENNRNDGDDNEQDAHFVT